MLHQPKSYDCSESALIFFFLSPGCTHNLETFVTVMRLLILVHPVLRPALETSELLLVRTSSVYDIQVVPLELFKLSNSVQTYHDNWPVWR